MNPIELGKFIANLRVEKKLTQEDLAEKLYVDKRKISRWECGTSIPDFDMLIKLSEILNVSLYELSICKRLDKEKLSTKAINKLKGIKDFKKYKLKKKLKIIFLIILSIFFIFTAIYTIKFYGTVEIYEFNSLDEKYNIKGTYIHANDNVAYNINKIYLRDNGKDILQDLDNCKFEIYSEGKRFLHIINLDSFYDNTQFDNALKLSNASEIISKKNMSKKLFLKISCYNNKINDNYLIKFTFAQKYDNKLF